MIKQHLIRNVNDLDSLQKKWKELQKGTDMTVFQSFEWNKLLLIQHLHNRYNRLFSKVYIYESDNTIVPIVVQKCSLNIRWFGRRRGIYFLGEGSYSDYLNCIYDVFSEYEITDVLNRIRNDFSNLTWKMSFLREGNALQKYLESKEVRVTHRMVSVEVRLPKTEEEYNAKLSKSTKQNLRTARNRMDRDSIEYECRVEEKKIDEKLADDLVPIHLRRVLEINSHSDGLINSISNWLHRKVLVHNETNNNIVNMAMKLLNNSVLVLCQLNGEVAGYLYGLKDNNTVRILQNCFVDNYKFYSPMFRGTYDFLKQKIMDREIDCVDFTRGDEEYKYKLGGEEINLYTYSIGKHIKFF